MRKNQKAEIGIIGGTGVYDPHLLKRTREVKLDTPYGRPSDKIILGAYKGKKIAFLPRHGKRHTIPPHRINYRANIWAMKRLGVSRILAPQAVGSLRERFKPGTLVLPDQFIDFTKHRVLSFYDGPKVAHIAMAQPFCSEMKNLLYKAAKKLWLSVISKGTYVCIEGPRFSTRAESVFFRTSGGDVIGMTVVPEAQLARELEICYASICTVTDYDVWKSRREVSLQEVLGVARANLDKTKKLLTEVISKIPPERKCVCKDALKDAIF